MKTGLTFILALFLFAGTAFSQTTEEKDLMMKIVKQGLDERPKSFFNMGTSYDYENNIKIIEITIPEDHDYTVKGPTCTFNIVLDYTQEGEKKNQKYSILGRNGSTGELEFYSARLR